MAPPQQPTKFTKSAETGDNDRGGPTELHLEAAAKNELEGNYLLVIFEIPPWKRGS